MPQQKEKSKVAPTPGLLRRIFGGPISESTSEQWPELADAWAQQEFSMPEETTWTNRVRPTNWLENMIMPDADALQWPWGTIAINRPLVEKNQQNLRDILTHELTHVGQTKRGGWSDFNQRRLEKKIPYFQRPSEKEAWEAERTRWRPKDIYLPTPTYSGMTGPTSASLEKNLKKKGGR